MSDADVAIVGGGVIGAAIAYELARSTALRIVVFERDRIGCGATGAAAGSLSVGSGRAPGGFMLGVRRHSAALFPDLVRELEEENGWSLRYSQQGSLLVACSASEADNLSELVSRRVAQGYHCRLLSRHELQRYEPALGNKVECAARFADDGQIDARRFLNALVLSTMRRGVRFQQQAHACVIDEHGRTVIRVAGKRFEAATTVVAAGAWSPEVFRGIARKVPVRAARGEVFAIRPKQWSLGSTVIAPDVQIVARGDGEVWVGGTNTYSNLSCRISSVGVAELRARAEALVPSIRGEPIVRVWGGLRPCSSIRRPIIARVPDFPQVILATGHHRSGILFAPFTARLVADMVIGRTPSISLTPFSYRRH